jgi:hypothetical protein
MHSERTTSASRPVDNRPNDLRKTASRRLRPFRYLRIPPQDRERVHLVRERVTPEAAGGEIAPEDQDRSDSIFFDYRRGFSVALV